MIHPLTRMVLTVSLIDNRMEWFKRQFAFDLPIEMCPNIIERLRGTPARLEELTHGESKEFLTRRDRDKWSIQEQAGHLLDLEQLWMKRLDDFEAGRDKLAPADLTNSKTHEANYNAKAIADILAAFRERRMEFVERLETYDNAILQRAASHPRLDQTLRVIDHIFFVAEHDDHHLARITELKRI